MLCVFLCSCLHFFSKNFISPIRVFVAKQYVMRCFVLFLLMTSQITRRQRFVQASHEPTNSKTKMWLLASHRQSWNCDPEELFHFFEPEPASERRLICCSFCCASKFSATDCNSSFSSPWLYRTDDGWREGLFPFDDIRRFSMEEYAEVKRSSPVLRSWDASACDKMSVSVDVLKGKCRRRKILPRRCVNVHWRQRVRFLFVTFNFYILGYFLFW